MDIVNQTRQLGDPHAGEDIDLTASRNALHRAIARGQRRSRKPLLAWAAGGLTAAGASAFVIGTVIAGASVVAPQTAAPASAAEVLQTTATVIENDETTSLIPAEGQYLKVHQDFDQLFTLGPDTGYPGDSPFAHYQRSGAIGGAITRWATTTYLPHDPINGETVIDSSLMHVVDTFGDRGALDAAWNDSYADSYGPIGAEPHHDVYSHPGSETLDDGSVFSYYSLATDYSTDPAEFRTAYRAELQRQADEMPDVVDPNWHGRWVTPDSVDETFTTLMMMREVANATWVVQPAEYRATVLRAVALDESLTVQEQGEGSHVFTFTSPVPDGWFSVTLDTSRAVAIETAEEDTVSYRDDLTKADGSQIRYEVGTSDILPADQPRMKTTLTYEIVDSAPAVTTGQ